MSSFDADDPPLANGGRRGPAACSDATEPTRVPSIADIREAVLEAARARAEAAERVRPFADAVRDAELRLLEAVGRARDALVVMPVVAAWVAKGERRPRSPTERTRLANRLHQQLSRRRRASAGRPGATPRE